MSNDYIARCRCGGFVFWVAESRVKDHANEIARLLKDGFAIERMQTDDVRKLEMCPNRGECDAE